jgi:hypothetical protein
MPFMFKKLEVYQKAFDFGDEFAALTQSFPLGYGFLVDQLNRAALSIATNLAEGNGRFTKPDRRNFFTIARNFPNLSPLRVSFALVCPDDSRAKRRTRVAPTHRPSPKIGFQPHLLMLI